jgi:hypothetical protein
MSTDPKLAALGAFARMVDAEAELPKAPTGLSADELTLLGGFQEHGFQALAHLRECWMKADPHNRPHVEAAIFSLVGGHSFSDYPGWVSKVLRHRHMRGDELMAAIFRGRR